MAQAVSQQLFLWFLLAMFCKSYKKKILIFLLSTMGSIGPCYSQDQQVKALIVGDGLPEVGKRVRVYLPKYPKAYYVLFLPYNFTDTAKFPVIFESPGNVYLELCDGLPDSACLGYGLSLGMDYIWVSVPFVDDMGHICRSYWGKDPVSTVDFWLAVLKDLNIRFRIDNERVILSGFSRGAISTSYIGNYNDEISSKWAAYYAHAHFDGCCQTLLGNAEERIARIQKKKVLISVGSDDIAKKCSQIAYEGLVKKGCSVSYIEVPGEGHSSFWILDSSKSSEEVRSWLRNLFSE